MEMLPALTGYFLSDLEQQLVWLLYNWWTRTSESNRRSERTSGNPTRAWSWREEVFWWQ